MMLDGKVVLVTGGTGALGRSICTTVARHGADVAFTCRKRAVAAQELCAEIEAAGRRCLWGEVDGCDSKGIEAFAGRVEEGLGAPHALVNNLGLTQVMPFALIEEEDWDEIVAVNLKSMFLFTRAVVRGMIRRRGGVVVNMGSIAGHRLLEVPVHYATAKAGVMGFTKSLARELCRYGIRVNAVAPGLIEGGIGHNVSERQLAEYNSYCALGRPGIPAEVAETVAFLISDRASYLNAQMIDVDGGL